jgi:hypothetical protein
MIGQSQRIFHQHDSQVQHVAVSRMACEGTSSRKSGRKLVIPSG